MNKSIGVIGEGRHHNITIIINMNNAMQFMEKDLQMYVMYTPLP